MCQVTVRLPSTLMQIVRGAPTLEVHGHTLREALDDLIRKRPALAVHLFDDAGALRHNVLCLHDGVHTGRRDSLDVPINRGKEITIVQAVSGG